MFLYFTRVGYLSLFSIWRARVPSFLHNGRGGFFFFLRRDGKLSPFLNEEEKVSLFTEARSGSSPCVSKEKRREGLSFLFEDRKEGLSVVSKTMIGKFCLHLLGVGTVFILFLEGNERCLS